MSREEDQTLRDVRAAATAYGEIVSATSDTITIQGWFTSGIAIELHAGARVVVLTENEAIALLGSRGGAEE